ncbi:hypothetical protein BKI52_29715 [marine bacterium AO1-C]|nr:hypothetical protein BKI52_29715 [marine bacterium AO1-C]
MAEYNVNNIEVSMFGESPFYGIREMTYDMEQEKTHVHVVGQSNPYSTQYSNKKFTGKITIIHSEFVKKIQAKIPKGLSVLDMAPFDISIVYLADATNLQTTDKWTGVEVTKTAKKFAAGDGVEAIEMEVIMLNVQEGV